MDGVVVETVQMHFQAWKRMFEEHGKPFTFDEYKAKVDGIPRRDGARAILGGLSPDELDRAVTRNRGISWSSLIRRRCRLIRAPWP